MPEEVHMFDLGCFLSDISDTLFTITQKPCPGAKDRHNTLPWSQGPTQQCVPHHMFDLGCFLSDIADTLFTMTQKPCPGANDRHNTYTSNVDKIQPGLTSLQPNLDDFMDIPVCSSCSCPSPANALTT
nr:carbohydrate-responsive element-binding protein-like [Oncorhynchus nerka]